MPPDFDTAQVAAGILSGLGGLGLFLLGMVVLTEGLRALAGTALRRFLSRFTRSAWSGATTGTLTTAVVQSSSATTVLAVGFVGAGLLTFPQALGIVLGANVGTTVTGWLVALVGFKLKLGTAALPLVLIGVLLKLFGQNRTASLGYAIAGFGLLFVGISFMQQGMGGLVGVVTPETFPSDTWLGRLMLILLGIGFTLLTQSSSAGVAMALTALSLSAITLPQAAALVIGMDVGTTVTTVLATLGTSVHARRTGYAHAFYNVLTGVGAYFLLVPFMWAIHSFAPSAARSHPELVLVGFHTFFNVLGVVAALPFATKLADFMVRLVPERPSPFAEQLDDALLEEPSAALDSLGATLVDLTAKTFELVMRRLRHGEARGIQQWLVEIRAALVETRRYVERIRTEADQGWIYRRHLSAMHVIDHLDRLLDRCSQDERWDTAQADRRLRELEGELLAPAIDSVRAALTHGEAPVSEKSLEDVWRSLENFDRAYREDALEDVASGRIDTAEAIRGLDAARMVRRVAYHAWRITHHLGRCQMDEEPGAPADAVTIPPHAEAEPPV